MEIELENVTLRVEYTINRGYAVTREEPGEPPHIEELYIYCGDQEISGLLSKQVMSTIEDLCWRNAESNDLNDF